MQLSLNTRQFTPMWFLGDPDRITVSLTIKDPGPVDIDFNKLNEHEQKKILLGLKNRILLSDTSFEDLYKTYKKRMEEQEEKEKSEEVRRYLEKQQERQETDKVLKLEARYQKHKEKVSDRSKYLTKKSGKAIQAALKDNDDIDLFRAMMEQEKLRKKPRTSVLRFLEEHIRKFEAQIAASIAAEESKSPVRLPKGEDFIIIEDDEEQIELVIDNSPKNERMLGEEI